VLAALHGQDPHGQDPRWWYPRWADHSYRVRLHDGPWRWAAEPYSLDPDAFADLEHLERHGFDVGITAWQARHYPGHTIAVLITESPGSPAATPNPTPLTRSPVWA
jgi:hypothetical protein